MPKPTKPKPACPRCKQTKHVVSSSDGEIHRCDYCRVTFDNDPNEGGDYSDRNPSARMERSERRRK